MVDAICNTFTKIGYKCTQEYNLRKTTGWPIRVDLFCRKQSDSLIVEVKTGYVRFEDIARLAYLRTLPTLSETTLYLAVPKATEFSNEQIMFLVQNNIRIIQVDGKGIVVFERPRPIPQLDSSQMMSLIGVSAYVTQRSIPPFLLEKLSFEGVAYDQELNKFVREYERVQNVNQEVDLVLKYIEKLWAGKYGKGKTAKAFGNFSDFEPVLKRIRGYRDHFTHPFQVFLLGSLIICRHRDLFEEVIKKKMPKIKKDTLDFSWLLASTFHDFCYPIQMFNDFTNNLFFEFLHTEEIDVNINLSNILLDVESLNYIDQLVCLYDFYDSSESKSQWIFNQKCEIDGELRKLFLEALMKSQDHGVLGSITLLKKIMQEDFVKKDRKKYLKGRFSTDVYPASLAIAFHNLASSKDELPIPKITFENSPLIVLLTYCDLVQEWGRPSKHRIEVKFADFQVGPKEISTAIVVKERKHFDSKIEYFKKAFKRLSSSELRFSLKILCEKDGADHTEPIPKK